MINFSAKVGVCTLGLVALSPVASAFQVEAGDIVTYRLEAARDEGDARSTLSCERSTWRQGVQSHVETISKSGVNPRDICENRPAAYMVVSSPDGLVCGLIASSVNPQLINGVATDTTIPTQACNGASQGDIVTYNRILSVGDGEDEASICQQNIYSAGSLAATNEVPAEDCQMEAAFVVNSKGKCAQVNHSLFNQWDYNGVLTTESTRSQPGLCGL